MIYHCHLLFVCQRPRLHLCYQLQCPTHSRRRNLHAMHRHQIHQHYRPPHRRFQRRFQRRYYRCAPH